MRMGLVFRDVHDHQVMQGDSDLRLDRTKSGYKWFSLFYLLCLLANYFYDPSAYNNYTRERKRVNSLVASGVDLYEKKRQRANLILATIFSQIIINNDGYWWS